MGKKKDWTGQKFGRITFIRPTNEKKSRAILWEALCDCGTTIYLIPYSAKTGNTKSCGCWKIDNHSENSRLSGALSRKHTPQLSSARKVWRSTYKDCDFDTFLRVSQLPCYICSRPPNRSYNVYGLRGYVSQAQKEEGDFIYNGLDRIDSSKGHTKDNVSPCCWDCNRAKGANTLEEFLKHIERMYHGTRQLNQAAM